MSLQTARRVDVSPTTLDVEAIAVQVAVEFVLEHNFDVRRSCSRG
jgi:hypothetical protein